MRREYTARIGSREFTVSNVAIVGDVVSFEVLGNQYAVSLEERSIIEAGAQPMRTPVNRSTVRPAPQPSSAPHPGALIAPISGVVVSINATVGETVAPGQVIAVLEAMKMENPIKSDRAGVIKEIHTKAGSQVRTGEAIVSFQ